MADERLIVALEARVRDFERNMARAERTGTRAYTDLRRRSRSATGAMERDMTRSTQRMNQALANTSQRMGNFGRAFAAGAVAAGVAAITTQVTRAIDSMAELGAMADRAGLDAEAFQEWSYVAEQNRISVDALTDGFKELSLRTDEFVTTGAGPAAEALERLGFTADELAVAIENPTALMDDLIDRMRDLDRAAQIRVADEIFGGTGGEQFVRLIESGSEGLRQLRQEARDAGVVLDQEIIERAEEIDREFARITSRVRTFFRTIVVEAVNAGAEIGGVRAEVEDLFRSLEQAEAILGDGAFGALEADAEAAARHAEEISRLRQMYEELADAAGRTVPQLRQAGTTMGAWDYDEAAASILRVATEMEELSRAIQDGAVDADEFEARMTDLTQEAEEAFGALSDIDRVEFSGAIGALDGLIRRLAEASGVAATLRANLPGGEPVGGRGQPATAPPADTPTLGPGLETSPIPGRRPDDIDWGYYPETSSGGGSGSMANAFEDDLARLIDSIRTEREILENWYQEGLDLLNDRRAMEILGEEEHHAARLRLEEEFQSQLAEIRGSSQNQTLQEASSFFGALQGIAEAGGEGMARAAATFGATRALINSYVAATEALQQPGLGVFGRLAAYGQVLATGLQAVSAIRSAGSGVGASSPSTSGVSASTATTATGVDQYVYVDLAGPEWLTSLADELLTEIYDQTANGDRRVVIQRV